jgi:hypothetical protein
MEDIASITRRGFVQRLGVLGTLGLGGATLLSACGGGEEAPSSEAAPQAAAPAAAPAAAQEGDFSCTDVSGLTEQERQMREQLQYVDHSPAPDQHCTNCQLYIEAAEGEQCGGCQLLKGPIHPDGYCTSWVAKQAT